MSCYAIEGGILKDAELRLGVSGLLDPLFPNGKQSTLHARIIENNYRKSEALLHETSPHPLELARVSIARGNLDEAQRLISSQLPSLSNPQDTCEWLLEHARVFMARGLWIETLGTTDAALSLPGTPPTLITLMQTRSMALFELGRFQEATVLIEKIRTFAEIYAHLPAAFYAHCLKIKIDTRLGDPESARLGLRNLWKVSLSRKSLNWDEVLTLLRVQADLKRLLRQDPLGEILGSYHIAKLMGDDLYEQMALAELFHIGSPLTQERALKILKQFPAIQPRTLALLQNPDSGTSAATLAGFSKSFRFQGDLENDSLSPPTGILFLDHGLQCNLNERHAKPVSLQPQVIAALSLLSGKQMPISEFFFSIWGIRRYSHDLHFENVRTLIKRMRQQTGLSPTLRKISGEPAVSMAFCAVSGVTKDGI